MTSVIRLAVTYFAIVFAVGFALGTVRVLWLVPALGERWAELSEMPFMWLASYLTARYLLRRSRGSLGWADALWAGLLALVLLLAVEFTVVLGLRGLTLSDYLASRDGVSGAAYVISLLAYAFMPALVWRLHGVRGP